MNVTELHGTSGISVQAPLRLNPERGVHGERERGLLPRGERERERSPSQSRPARTGEGERRRRRHQPRGASIGTAARRATPRARLEAKLDA